MAEKLQNVIRRAEELIETAEKAGKSGVLTGGRWKMEIALLRDQISFFQHERLIHLLVTILFAFLTFFGFCFFLIIDVWYVLLIEFLFVVLLIPYLFHYYNLENGVQRLYSLYEKLVLLTEASE